GRHHVSVRQVKPLRCRVVLDHDTVGATRLEDGSHVEVDGVAPADEPAGGVPEHVDLRMAYGRHHAGGLLGLAELEEAVNADHHDVQPLKPLVGKVECAVLEDVHLHATQDSDVV